MALLVLWDFACIFPLDFRNNFQIGHCRNCHRTCVEGRLLLGILAADVQKLPCGQEVASRWFAALPAGARRLRSIGRGGASNTMHRPRTAQVPAGRPEGGMAG